MVEVEVVVPAAGVVAVEAAGVTVLVAEPACTVEAEFSAGALVVGAPD